MCVKFPEKPKSIKERTKVFMINLNKFVNALVIALVMAAGVAFITGLITKSIILNPKLYYLMNPGKKESKQLTQIKLLINKLRAEQYK
jgi:hypothetical protein